MHGQGRQKLSQHRVLCLRGRQGQPYRRLFRRHLPGRCVRQTTAINNSNKKVPPACRSGRNSFVWLMRGRIPEGIEMQGMTSAGGLSKARLGRMHDIMAGHVECGNMPGLVTLVSRHGEIHVDVIGKMVVGGAPMRRDSIFRITSMTKPVTAAAAM